MTSDCCAHARSQPPRARGAVRGFVEWVLPGAVFLAIPKCPACVAAYIALATGVGVSLSTAAHLRFVAIAICVAAIAYVIAKRALRWLR